MTITVAIADDQELVRAGLRMIVEGESDLKVVGQASTGEEAVALAMRTHPEVLLMDVRMPDLDGIRATKRIVSGALTPGTKILMLTTFDLDEYVYEAIRAGANGFLLKEMPGEDIVIAIRQAARGADSLLAPALTRRLIERFATSRAASSTPPSALSDLTTRELQVLRLIARGLSNSEIATELTVSDTTVKTHVGRVLMKLGLRDRVQAVVFAYETGMVCRA